MAERRSLSVGKREFKRGFRERNGMGFREREGERRKLKSGLEPVAWFDDTEHSFPVCHGKIPKDLPSNCIFHDSLPLINQIKNLPCFFRH